MPTESVTTTGYWAALVDPGVTMDGLPVICTTTSVLTPFGPFWRVQVALEPQTTSATVLVLPPLQKGKGPAFVAGPQSLSVTRITALPASETATLKSIVTLSPASRIVAKPPDDVRIAEVEIGPPLAEAGSMRRSCDPGRFQGPAVLFPIPEVSGMKRVR